MLESSLESNRSTLLAQAVRIACKAVSVVLAARLLSPADHGLYAMAASATLLLMLLRDFGFGTASVQAPSIDERQLATLFWIHLGLGALLAVATVGLAPVARWFYRADAVQPVLLAMSPSFLLLGAGGLARSQLARELRFTELNRIETAAAVAGTAVLVGAAAAGAGPYAFVSYLLVSEAAITGLAWRAWRWRPRLAFVAAAVRPLIRTGTDLTAYGVLGHLTQQLDTFVVGQAFGPRILGLYNRSGSLLALPGLHIALPLTNVALATLSRLGPESPHFRAHACRTATTIAHLTLPLAAVCVALPHDVIRIILGAQWPDAAPMLRWLALSAAVTAVTSLAYAINVAAGRTRQLVTSMSLVLPATGVAIYLGYPHGATGIAAALSLTSLALAAPRLAWALRGSPVRVRDYAAALVGPLLAATLLAAGLFAGSEVGSRMAAGGRLTVALLCGAAAVGGLALVSPRVRNEFRFVWRHLPWTDAAG